VKREQLAPRNRWAARLLFAAMLMFALSAHAVPEIAEPAPPLKGTLFSGEPFDLGQMRGKVVLVNFYSSYCKYCAYEIGNVETIYEKYRPEGLEVIEIGVDALEDRGRVQRMLGIYHLPGTMADELLESGFERRYPTPTAFLIDRRGILRHKQWGAKTATYFNEVVVPLLKER
jgi:cytochrome c biogenesis protein CcmG, thiol:disulfide interchange protein DsbE